MTDTPPPHWIEYGVGDPAVVCLHGISGGALGWRAQLPALARERRRVLAWDMPGYGRSPALSSMDFESLARALEALLDAAAIARAVLVGHSLGGMIALDFAARRPERVRALVLACTAPAFGAPAGPAQQAFLDRRLGLLDRGGSMGELAAEVIPAMLAEGAREGLRREHCALMTAIPATSYRAAMLALIRFDRRQSLASLSCPVLCVAGAEDRVSSPLVMRGMAERVPDGHYAELAGAGHLAPFERALEFAAQVDGFLAARA